MKSFTYPAVVFSDDPASDVVIAIYDLSLFAEGSTVEEAHANMEDLLSAHMSYAMKHELLFNDPTPFVQVVKEHPRQMVVLVEAKLDDKNNPIK